MRGRPRSDEERAFLASYDPTPFERQSVTVDVAVMTIREGRLSILLVERRDHPYKGAWALPGGFVGPDEDLEQAAWRELEEETSLSQAELAEAGVHLEQLKTYGTPGRDPRLRVVSVAHVAIGPHLPSPRAGDDAAQARFWAVEDLGVEGVAPDDAPELAFDHAEIVRDALERVRSKLEYTALATSFVEEPFALSELRRVYEVVWGAAPELNTFRRKVLKTPGFVVPAETQRGTPTDRGGRPPQLFRRGGAVLLHPAMLRQHVADADDEL
jgi:8-oxo-dGTP diphosphatase